MRLFRVVEGVLMNLARSFPRGFTIIPVLKENVSTNIVKIRKLNVRGWFADGMNA